jgi:hypothetical protein
MMHKITALLVLSLLMAGCGGSSGSSSPAPQGVYSGPTTLGTTLESIVLPNGKLYALYGNTSGNVFTVQGLVAGQGKSNNGTYTSSPTDYYYTGATYPWTLTASYVIGSSFNGAYSAGGLSETFTGSVIPNFSFNTPALLSKVTGTWSGALMDGESATAIFNSSGNFAGVSTSGCDFSGTITPDSSNDNFFDVSFSFGGSPCAKANQTMSGIAVDYLLPDNVTNQLVMAVASGNNGTTFVANK